MRNLSEEAFVTMGVCSKTNQPFGITVDRADTKHKEYVFVWAFKINAAQAHREGYDTKTVRGSITIDNEYPGCPYCGSDNMAKCTCGKTFCFKFPEYKTKSIRLTCPWCGQVGMYNAAETLQVQGGGF